MMPRGSGGIAKVPATPVDVALVGAGARATAIYAPLLETLRPWLRVTAVCDPVQDHASFLARRIGARPFGNVHDLVRARNFEAALVCTPVDSHHSISLLLSSHGIPNLIETSWASTLAQAQEMKDAASASGTIVRVAENFFRWPVDRFAQLLKRSGYIGSIGRIVSYNDHSGYHNNSRWIRFAGSYPTAVQSISHTMRTDTFTALPDRPYTDETFVVNLFSFDGLFVSDSAANIKGFLGRHARPGYTEWQGESGTLVHRASRSAPNLEFESESELRKIASPADAGHASARHAVLTEFEGNDWTRVYAETEAGILEYRQSLRSGPGSRHPMKGYGDAVMGHLVDFALEVRGLAPGEFSDDDALMSMMMEVGAVESRLAAGARLSLPLTGPTEADDRVMREQRNRYGVDPMDVEAMLDVVFARP